MTTPFLRTTKGRPATRAETAPWDGAKVRDLLPGHPRARTGQGREAGDGDVRPRSSVLGMNPPARVLSPFAMVLVDVRTMIGQRYKLERFKVPSKATTFKRALSSLGGQVYVIRRALGDRALTFFRFEKGPELVPEVPEPPPV